MDNMVKKLVDDRGMSKWAIARQTGVSWNTVALWYKGVYSPKDEHREKLEAVYGLVESRQNPDAN